jgi:hypothetical protein
MSDRDFDATPFAAFRLVSRSRASERHSSIATMRGLCPGLTPAERTVANSTPLSAPSATDITPHQDGNVGITWSIFFGVETSQARSSTWE